MANVQNVLVAGLVAATASSLCVFALNSMSDSTAQPVSLTEAAASIEKRLDALERRTPGLDMLKMNAQTHFSKLWYAVAYENWDLASYELAKLNQRLDQAALARPEEAGVNLVALTEALKNGPLARIQSEVIAKKDKSDVKTPYTEAIQLCNACHQQTGRGFIRMQIPSAPPLSSQDWNPTPK